MRELEILLNTLEGVYKTPSALLDKTEALNKIMEAYKAYRRENDNRRLELENKLM